jgi:hypothetical protein
VDKLGALLAGLKAKADGQTSLLEWVLKWAGWIVTAFSIVWAGLLTLAAKNDLHLVAWVEKEVPVYPARDAWEKELPLSYEGTLANSVSVWAVKVSNYGRTLIGRQDDIWRLWLDVPYAERVAVLGPMTANPRAIHVKQAKAEKPTSVMLEFGALEPRAYVDFQLMVVNIDERRRAPLELRTSLAGLPKEVVSAPPETLIQSKIFRAVFVSMVLLVLVVFGRNQYAWIRSHAAGLSRAWGVIASVAGVLILALMLGAVATVGLSKLIVLSL